jgi:hypothetical protein
MLRSQSIQRDKIPVNRRTAKVQQPVASNSGTNAAHNLTFFYGVGYTSDFIAKNVLQHRPNTRIVDVKHFLSGSVKPTTSVMVWGILRGGEQVINYARKYGLDYYYVDNGYFKQDRKNFRISKNSTQQLSFIRNADVSRFQRLSKPVQPWRQTDPSKSIIVCPPTTAMKEFHGCWNWLEKTLEKLKSVTTRTIEVREKPAKVEAYRRSDGILDTYDVDEEQLTDVEPIESVLGRAHAVVTFNSTVFIPALLQGVPVFSDKICGASLLGNTDVLNIENPELSPNRGNLFVTLANCQWSWQEIQTNLPWRNLR